MEIVIGWGVSFFVYCEQSDSKIVEFSHFEWDPSFCCCCFSKELINKSFLSGGTSCIAQVKLQICLSRMTRENRKALSFLKKLYIRILEYICPIISSECKIQFDISSILGNIFIGLWYYLLLPLFCCLIILRGMPRHPLCLFVLFNSDCSRPILKLKPKIEKEETCRTVILVSGRTGWK